MRRYPLASLLLVLALLFLFLWSDSGGACSFLYTFGMPECPRLLHPGP